MLHPHHLFDETGGGTVHSTDYILIKKGWVILVCVTIG
jgi:hypothetical protein